MAEHPSSETSERQHHNLGERDKHLPRDSRGGSDSDAGSGRQQATQNDPPHGTPAEATRRWDEDLGRDDMPGRNVGLQGEHPEKDDPRTAYDIKAAHRALSGIADDDLRRIPIMPRGSRLEQGATYLDLRDPEGGEFTATGDQTAEGGHWYVPKTDVPYQIWNQLIGGRNPERRGEASET
jgi:hypothetical protein